MISPSATIGAQTVIVTTGAEVVSVPSVFNIQAGVPTVTGVAPNTGQQGQQNLFVTITGQFTNFVQGTSQVSFGAGITVGTVTISSPASLTASISIAGNAAAGPHAVTVTTGAEVASLANGFTVGGGTAIITQVTPNAGQQGQANLTVAITGQFTNFVQGTSQATFGAGITVNSITVVSATSLSASITVAANATAGARTVSVTTGIEAASLANGFTVQAGTPVLSTLVPNSAQQGQTSLAVTITGQATNFVQGTSPVTFGQGITVNTVTVTNATSLTANITVAVNSPAGPRTVTVTTGTEVATSVNGFTVAAGTVMISTVNPSTAPQGQSNLAVAITGQFTGFSQGTSVVSFGQGITVGTVAVTSATNLTAQISVAGNAPLGARAVTVTTGTEVASLANAFTVTTAVNQPPVITIAPTWSVVLPNRLTATYTVTDDGLPLGGALTVSWSTIATPAGATVGYQNQTNTSISVGFDAAGTYTLRITATDTQFTVFKDITVTVTTSTLPPPTVSISAPLDGAEVTTAINVAGSVNSTSLTNWVLEYQKVGDSGFTSLTTGTTIVTNATLGTFDPSLLVNGLYNLRLRATDTGGRSTTTAPISLVLTKNQKIGNFTVSFNDLSVPVAGLPIQVVRTYDSRRRSSPADFSYGWTLDVKTANINESVAIGGQWTETTTGGTFPTYCLQPNQAHVLTVTLPEGTTYQFNQTLTPSCQQLVPILQTTIGFAPTGSTPPNVGLAMIANNVVVVNGTLGGVTLLDADGISTLGPDQYILTLPDGRTLHLSRQFCLKSLSDLNGNTLTVTAAGITHSSGKSVIFSRNAAQLITKITDPAGNAINYTYDNLTGDLTSVTDRTNQTTTFTYDTGHGLLTIKDPRGVQPIRNDYDARGRLISHTDAYGNVINYTHNLATRQEIATDRLGNITVNEYDTDGNVVKVTDALGGITQRTYDGHGNVLTEAHALGNTRTYTYDANDNRLTEKDPLGATTTYTYNSRKQVLTVTDSLGRVTTNVYDANGNLTSTKDAAGNTTTYTYTTSGLQQSATDALGNLTSYVYDASGNLTQQTDPLLNVTTFTTATV